MNIIHITLGILLGGAVLTYFANKISGILRDILFAGSLITAAVLFFMQIAPDTVATFNLGGLNLSLSLSHLGLLFSFIILGLGVLAGIYSIPYMKDKENLGYFYMNFLLSIFGMLGIVMSQDLVSFFIFWEIMTWSSYLLVVYNGNDTNRIGIKYIVFSAIGAYSMLTAIVMVYSQLHSFNLADLFGQFTSMPASIIYLTISFLLFAIAISKTLTPSLSNSKISAPLSMSNMSISSSQ
jgi:NADH-quinone oxidoreductase subunit M